MHRPCFGLIAGLITVQIPVAVWERWAPWVFVAALLLLSQKKRPSSTSC